MRKTVRIEADALASQATKNPQRRLITHEEVAQSVIWLFCFRQKTAYEILDAVRRGLAETKGPAPPSRADVPPGLGPLVELLRVLLKQRCEEHQVAQKLVATAEDLEAVAADDDAPVPALSGWRYEIFGKDALALKHGRLALTVRRNRITLIELADANGEQ